MRNLPFNSRRNNKAKIITAVVVVVLILGFIFTLGIKILLNTSIFVANIFNKNQITPTVANEDVYGSISIDNIPTATNSARIVVSGSVVNYSILRFYINGDKIKEKILDSSDNFSEEIGDLVSGNNEVFVKVLTKDQKKSKNSTVFKVFYSNQKPKLDISEPSDNSKTSQQDLTIKGTTDKEVFIKVNDIPVVVDANGSWETSVKLKDGDNQIVITASDTAGNMESKTITVNYQKDN